MKFAFFFLVLAALTIQVLLKTEAVARWLLLWPATSFAVLGLAYLGLGPRSVGKRQDGRIAPWALLLHLPYLGQTYLLWHLQRLLSREEAANEVAPGVWVGRRPYPSELPPACALVVDLTCEFSAHPGVVEGRTYLVFPTLDGTAPRAKTLEAVAAMANEGPILFHCAAGHGRSATCAAALLLARGKVATVTEAETLMQAARPRISLNASQRAALERLVLRLAERRNAL